MSIMNVSLPDCLESFVDEQVVARGFETRSEYVCELIRKDLARQRLRGLLMHGARSAQTTPAGDAYFEELRKRTFRG